MKLPFISKHITLQTAIVGPPEQTKHNEQRNKQILCMNPNWVTPPSFTLVAYIILLEIGPVCI
jgi:hypothetical protein